MQTTKIIKALDVLGYNKEIAEKRIWIGKNNSEGTTRYHSHVYGENIDVVLTGSRREGLGTTLDNDVDQMFIDNSILCVGPEEIESYKDLNNYHTIFLLNTQSAPAGYSFLELSKMNPTDAEIPIEIKDALVSHNGSIFLRNDKVRLKAVAPLLGTAQQHFTDGGWLKKTYGLNEDKNGPSASYTMKIPYLNCELKFDDCLAFQCRVPKLVKLWCARKREFDWPFENDIRKIETLPSHVVPVGMKGHPEHALQWRICLTYAEIALVESFNDTQIKVYAVMKNLAKHVLRKICHGISSYIMKNIIFWISEEVPIAEFQTKDFSARLRHAFYYLNNCILRRKLPSYMIVERNLLEGKVSDTERKQLLQMIKVLASEGPSVVLRIPEVLEEVNHPNEEVRKKKTKKREFAEQALLATFVLPPAETEDLQRSFLAATTPEHFLEIYMKRVIPYIRSSNPQGFFTHLLADDKHIYKYILEYAKL